MVILLLGAAVMCMVLGHICRGLRWKLFISVYEEASYGNLLNAMTIGYTLNTLLPVRIGEIARIIWSGKKLKNGFSLSVATVVADVYLDVLTVGIMFFGLLFMGKGGENLRYVAYAYMLIFLVVFLFTLIAVFCRKQIKKAVKKIASLFNLRIEFIILYVTYLCIASLKDIIRKIKKGKLIVLSIGTWAGYLLSYTLFAEAIQRYGIFYTTSDIFTELFSGSSMYHIPREALPIWSAYLVFPLIICALISLMISKKENRVELYKKTLPQMNEADRLSFLETYYMDENRENIQAYLDINGDVVVMEDASAGSNASTVVVMKEEGELFFRKYAFHDHGKKLRDQVEWIEAHQKDIPLPVISEKRYDPNYVTYDMPSYGDAVGLFRYIHTMPMEQSWSIIEKALEDIKTGLHNKNVCQAKEETIDAYIDSKVTKNLHIINTSDRYIRNLEQFSQLVVNGRTLPTLKHYHAMFEKEHLREIFEGDSYADIHGDMTIENIICFSDRDYYFIDPNADNIHNSPLLDFGKLLQSLHGNYEFLMMVKSVQIDENRVSFMMTKSENYGRLYKRYGQYLLDNFSDRDVLSIYYHEIVHWLRLMPYKIRKNEKLAVVFYIGLLAVLHDVWEMEHDKR